MKNIALALWALWAFASCNYITEYEIAPINSGETVPVEIAISSVIPGTRVGFFDDVAEFTTGAETYINIINIYVFNSLNEQVLTKKIEPEVNGSYMTTIELPKELCGTTCTIYASANANMTLSNTNPIYGAYYYANMGFPHRAATFSEMMTEQYWKDAAPFIMSASKEVEIQPYGFKTFTEMELHRVEAKVAVRLKISDDFTATHNGATLEITNLRLTNLSRYTYIFRDRPYDSRDFSSTQEPFIDADGYHHYLFYIFSRSNNSYPATGVIYATYDYDGDPTTTDDRTEVELEFLISETGEVKRNTYYRIDGLIKGVGRLNLDSQFTVAPWGEESNDLTIGG